MDQLDYSLSYRSLYSTSPLHLHRPKFGMSSMILRAFYRDSTDWRRYCMDTAQSPNPRQSNPMVVCTVQLKMSMDASYPTSKTCLIYLLLNNDEQYGPYIHTNDIEWNSLPKTRPFLQVDYFQKDRTEVVMFERRPHCWGKWVVPLS